MKSQQQLSSLLAFFDRLAFLGRSSRPIIRRLKSEKILSIGNRENEKEK